MSTVTSPTTPVRGYRELIVWQKSIELAERVYALTNEFPMAARFALSDQLQRAAVSVASNIAEGNRRQGVREYRRFLSIAHGSLGEVDTQLEIAVRIGYATRAKLAATDLPELIDHIGRMLTNLSSALRT